jgi:hypothetical protein
MKKTKKLSLRSVRTTESKKHDKVCVTGFSVKPVNPKPGKAITIKMTIQNVSGKLLKSVPWQIVKNKKILDHGVRFNLSAGDTFKVSTSWTAAKGSHFFYADADPKNTLKEPKIKQFNNLPQGTDIKVK